MNEYRLLKLIDVTILLAPKFFLAAFLLNLLPLSSIMQKEAGRELRLVHTPQVITVFGEQLFVVRAR